MFRLGVIEQQNPINKEKKVEAEEEEYEEVGRLRRRRRMRGGRGGGGRRSLCHDYAMYEFSEEC